MMTRSPGRAFVVINVVIDTPISRAMTAVSGAMPSGSGRVCSAIWVWLERWQPIAKRRSPRATPLTPSPISSTSKTAA
jgi:hypothetical protein